MGRSDFCWSVEKKANKFFFIDGLAISCILPFVEVLEKIKIWRKSKFNE